MKSVIVLTNHLKDVIAAFNEEPDVFEIENAFKVNMFDSEVHNVEFGRVFTQNGNKIQQILYNTKFNPINTEVGYLTYVALFNIPC